MSQAPREIAVQTLLGELKTGYDETYGTWLPEYGSIIAWGAGVACNLHMNLGDAPYHDLDHTIDVIRAAQEILIARHIVERVLPEDWLHVLLAAAFHDIGFVRQLLPEDAQRDYPPGCTGAALTSEHVDRGKAFVRRRFAGHAMVDPETLASYIEMTRFPIPDDPAYEDGSSYAGLVRAADFIGQLSNLHHRSSQWALFQEMKENGSAELLGYENADDLRNGFPTFFFESVRDCIATGARILERTVSGRQIINNLFGNIFRAQHPDFLGPS